jgi:NADH dehydrogenase
MVGHDSQHRIGLVADQNIMVFQPLLAEVAAAALSSLDVVSPLRELCSRLKEQARLFA